MILISKDGLLGGAFSGFFPEVKATSRKLPAEIQFDLRDDPKILPSYETVILMAGKTRFRDCELDKDAWSINVDAPVRIAHHCRGQFIVYVSSEAAEWANQTAYGSQKREVESRLLSVVGYGNLAIVRPQKITTERIAPVCTLIERIGREKLCGIHRI